MTSGRLWILTPVYLDVASFIVLRQRLLEVLSRSAGLDQAEVRFIVVDDTGGVDAEIDRLRRLDDVTVIVPPFNLGHQRAIVYGVRSVAAEMGDHDIVVTLDSDGEDRPEDLPRLLAPVLGDGPALNRVALALRTGRQESPAFKALYFSFRLFFRALTGVLVRTGNYAAYRGRIAKRVLTHPYFDLSYSSTLVGLNLAIGYVPCERGTRYAGESRMSYSKLIAHGLSMLVPFVDRIALRALLVFSATMMLSSLAAAAVVGIRLFTDLAIPGWATYTLLLLITLSFVALGNFVVLFVVFAQSRGLSLSTLERPAHQPARSASLSPD